ncbi:MAG: hypothetical protein ACI4EA_10240 [Candidatus Ornithomonoglobus sp.]
MFHHNEHSKFFKYWFIASIITVVMIGIIAGFVFSIEDYSYYSADKFNWLVAIMIWISGIIPAAVLYAIYSHLDNQEVQINNLNEIRKSLDILKASGKDTGNVQRNTVAQKPSVSTKPRTINNVVSGDIWVCPLCKTKNPAKAKRCSNCNSENFNL